MPTLHLHGPARLARDDGPALLLSAREAALLAWLWLEGPTPRARIAGLLWPAGSEAQARANLRQALVRLRRAAGGLVAEVDGLLQLAAGLAPADEPALPLLGALAFDDAPEFADWLALRRDQALRRHQLAQLQTARAHFDRGELDPAQAAADAVLATHPESEEAWRLRMEVFEQRGDRASALQAWDECRLALRAAFGVAPSPATQAIGERLLHAPAVAAAPGLPAGLRRPPQLVGREAQRAELQQALALGRAPVLLGPGGIGKTRLLAEAAAGFEPALVVGARPGDALRPGALLQRLLAAALPRFQPALDEATQAQLARVGLQEGPALKSALEHQRLLAAVGDALLACHRRGLRLLALDDLQFADDASLQALQALAAAVLPRDAEPGLRLLCAARDDELQPAAAALVEQLLQSGRGQRLGLPPLPAASLQQLLADLALPEAAALDLPALAAALHQQLGGNPGFVLESLKSLWLDGLAAWSPGQALPLPPNLLEAVQRRLQRLSPEALQLAQLAAVARADFGLDLAAAVLQRDALALAVPLAALQAAQVFDGQAFAHDLLADAVQASLAAPLAALLHRRVAQQLMQAGPAAAAGVAHHLQAAGDAAAAAPWLLQAAAQAAGAWQMVAAAQAYERAAPLLPRERAFHAWREAARGWIVAGRAIEAERALQSAEGQAGDAREQVLLLVTRINWGLNNGRTAQAVAQARSLVAALPAAAPALNEEELAQVVFSCTMVAPSSPEPEALAAMCEGLRERAAGHPRLLARLDLAQGLSLHWAGRVAAARPLLQRAWQQAHAGQHHGEAVNIGHQLARVQALWGDTDAALAVCRETRAAVQRAGAGPGFEADVLHQEALLQLLAGQPQAALDSLQRCEALHRLRGRPPIGFNAAASALVWLMLGRAERAEQALEDAGPLPAEPISGAVFLALARLRCLRQQGAAADEMLALAEARCASQQGVLAQRVAVQRLRIHPGAAELASELHAWRERGLRALLPSARQAAGLPFEPFTACDLWCDEPAALWLEGGQADVGARWVRRAAATFRDEADRQAWCQGNPLHAALLQHG
jgi:DNA-binding SARP family transcriptional activator